MQKHSLAYTCLFFFALRKLNEKKNSSSERNASSIHVDSTSNLHSIRKFCNVLWVLSMSERVFNFALIAIIFLACEMFLILIENFFLLFSRTQCVSLCVSDVFFRFASLFAVLISMRIIFRWFQCISVILSIAFNWVTCAQQHKFQCVRNGVGVAFVGIQSFSIFDTLRAVKCKRLRAPESSGAKNKNKQKGKIMIDAERREQR